MLLRQELAVFKLEWIVINPNKLPYKATKKMSYEAGGKRQALLSESELMNKVSVLESLNFNCMNTSGIKIYKNIY